MKTTTLVLVGFVLAIAYISTAITALPVAHAFPCSGGSGKEYCKGYHAGAVQADKDNAKGFIDDSRHHCNGSADYCNGWSRGYNDEGGKLQ